MEFVVSYKIKGKAPTINHQYSQKGYRRFKSAEYLAWDKAVGRVVNTGTILKDIEGEKLHFKILIGSKWVGKTTGGEPLRKDVDGRIKSILDSVTSFIGIDDKWIWELEVCKVESVEEEVEVRIYVLPR